MEKITKVRLGNPFCDGDGSFVFLFPADEMPDKDQIEKFYMMSEDSKYWKEVYKVFTVDRLVVKRDDENVYIVIPMSDFNKQNLFHMEGGGKVYVGHRQYEGLFTKMVTDKVETSLRRILTNAFIAKDFKNRKQRGY